MTASTRRAAIGAILAAPLAPVLAAAAPSDLARACEWATGHLKWINDPGSNDGDWPDDRLHDELAKVDVVLERIANEPSVSLADLRAKVRFILISDGEYLGMSDCLDDRAILAVLREVMALCA